MEVLTSVGGGLRKKISEAACYEEALDGLLVEEKQRMEALEGSRRAGQG